MSWQNLLQLVFSDVDCFVLIPGPEEIDGFHVCVATLCPRRARANVMQAFGNTWGLVPEDSLKRGRGQRPSVGKYGENNALEQPPCCFCLKNQSFVSFCSLFNCENFLLPFQKVGVRYADSKDLFSSRFRTRDTLAFWGFGFQVYPFSDFESTNQENRSSS